MVDVEQRQPKPHLSFEKQLQVLKDRGLHVGDDALALKYIQRIGYYRLSGYFYPLRQTNPIGQQGRQDQFVDGSSFELVVKVAEFDKKLRLIVLHALETVEVTVRVAVAHRLGKLDPEAHLISRFLDGKFCQSQRYGKESDHAEWLKRFQAAYEKSKEEFVEHHRTLYGGRMPIWVAVELWDFGLLSRFVAGMQHRDQNSLAIAYGLNDGSVLKSWMRMFNFIRNVAAHHSRLWNRSLPETPVLPPLERCRWLEPLHKDKRAHSKMFGALTCLRMMLKSIAPDSEWHEQLKAHIATFPKSDFISIEAMGFPEGWESLQIWVGHQDKLSVLPEDVLVQEIFI
ncbi:MAG: Abi family protein [Pseudomonadota bacterium]|nr:Abi family protein [Pseudomonadota bacterium]